MIVIAGGSGNLGTALVPMLAARGLDIRVLTRDPVRTARHLPPGLEIVAADVGDAAAVDRAIAGSQTVISAITGFGGPDAGGVAAIDRDGNRRLISAARAHGVEHFILVSVAQAAADHPIELFRMKFAAEQELRASGLAWTIIRPTAYMETWVGLVGRPLLESGKTRIFGAGNNPINFVSARDVAALIDLAAIEPGLRGEVLEIGGPENMTLNELAVRFEAGTGRTGVIGHAPLPIMRAMALLLRPIKPVLAGQIRAGVVMDTRDMSFDSAKARLRYPLIKQTGLEEMVIREYPRSSSEPSRPG
jgi:uncharacterized protein YbjT (DUF2867 family)